MACPDHLHWQFEQARARRRVQRLRRIEWAGWYFATFVVGTTFGLMLARVVA